MIWLYEHGHTRYLIVPWAKVRSLASHLLGRVARRLSQDWQGLYHHPIDLLESFVDTERLSQIVARHRTPVLSELGFAKSPYPAG